MGLARKLATVLHRIWVDGTEVHLGQGHGYGHRRVTREGKQFGAGPPRLSSHEVPSPGRGDGETDGSAVAGRDPETTLVRLRRHLPPTA